MHVVIQPGHFKLSFVVNYFCMYPCHAYADLIFVVACVRGSVCNFVISSLFRWLKKKKKKKKKKSAVEVIFGRLAIEQF